MARRCTFLVQPVGTAPAQVLSNRGSDPELIASANSAFFNACKRLLHPQPRANNNRSVRYSSVVSLIGRFFIVVDPSVLGAVEAGHQISDAALASLINFFVTAGAPFDGQDFHTVHELWGFLRANVYDEFFEYLLSDESVNNAISPDAILTLPKLIATEQPGGNATTRCRSEHVRRVKYGKF